jgi:hypothetical protein
MYWHGEFGQDAEIDMRNACDNCSRMDKLDHAGIAKTVIDIFWKDYSGVNPKSHLTLGDHIPRIRGIRNYTDLAESSSLCEYYVSGKSQIVR